MDNTLYTLMPKIPPVATPNKSGWSVRQLCYRSPTQGKHFGSDGDTDVLSATGTPMLSQLGN